MCLVGDPPQFSAEARIHRVGTQPSLERGMGRGTQPQEIHVCAAAPEMGKAGAERLLSPPFAEFLLLFKAGINRLWENVFLLTLVNDNLKENTEKQDSQLPEIQGKN